MKKAYLVTFEITTRVVTEEEGDPNGNLIIEADRKAFDDVVSKAYSSLDRANDCVENITEIVEDTECPYGTFDGEK